MTIDFSKLSFEEVQAMVNLSKQELRKRYYNLAMEKSKKIHNDLQELGDFIAEMGGDIDTGLNDNWQGVTLGDCLNLFNENYFDPLSFFPDEFFD